MEFIVIIPALNPEPCLEKLVDRLWELENQVLVVDDGSEKEFRESFQRLEKKCIVLHHTLSVQGAKRSERLNLQFCCVTFNRRTSSTSHSSALQNCKFSSF